MMLLAWVWFTSSKPDQGRGDASLLFFPALSLRLFPPLRNTTSRFSSLVPSDKYDFAVAGSPCHAGRVRWPCCVRRDVRGKPILPGRGGGKTRLTLALAGKCAGARSFIMSVACVDDQASESNQQQDILHACLLCSDVMHSFFL